MRDAPREHLRQLTIRSRQERDRTGYAERPSGTTMLPFGNPRLRGRKNSAVNLLRFVVKRVEKSLA